MISIAGQTGRRAIQVCDEIVTLFAFTYKLFNLLFTSPREGRTLLRRVILEQVYFTAVQALWIIIPIALFIGSMLFIHFAEISKQYDLGKTTVILVVRELGPIITAFLVILRSATAVTIETSYMNVLKETEMLEMAGIDPIRFVCLPRLIGITTAVLCLFIIFDLVAIGGGFFVVWASTHLSLGTFLDQITRAITAADIIVGIIKAFLFGIIITVTSISHGFRKKQQMTEIPVATSKSAVHCVFYCLITDVIISALFYL